MREAHIREHDSWRGWMLSGQSASRGGRHQEVSERGGAQQAITITNVSCGAANKVIRKHVNGVKKPYGYTCTPFSYSGEER